MYLQRLQKIIANSAFTVFSLRVDQWSLNTGASVLANFMLKAWHHSRTIERLLMFVSVNVFFGCRRALSNL